MKKNEIIMVGGEAWPFDGEVVNEIHAVLENAEGRWIISRKYDNGYSIGDYSVEYRSKAEAVEAIHAGESIHGTNDADMHPAQRMIRKIRNMAGVSQAKFAEEYGIPRRTLEDWEAGKRTPPAYVVALLEKAVQANKEAGE